MKGKGSDRSEALPDIYAMVEREKTGTTEAAEGAGRGGAMENRNYKDDSGEGLRGAGPLRVLCENLKKRAVACRKEKNYSQAISLLEKALEFRTDILRAEKTKETILSFGETCRLLADCHDRAVYAYKKALDCLRRIPDRSSEAAEMLSSICMDYADIFYYGGQDVKKARSLPEEGIRACEGHARLKLHQQVMKNRLLSWK